MLDWLCFLFWDVVDTVARLTDKPWGRRLLLVMAVLTALVLLLILGTART